MDYVNEYFANNSFDRLSNRLERYIIIFYVDIYNNESETHYFCAINFLRNDYSQKRVRLHIYDQINKHIDDFVFFGSYLYANTHKNGRFKFINKLDEKIRII